MTNQNPQQQTPSLEDLNSKVHDLVYMGSDSGTQIQPDIERGKELARKIKENIAAYQNEISTPRQSSIQAW